MAAVERQPRRLAEVVRPARVGIHERAIAGPEFRYRVAAEVGDPDVRAVEGKAARHGCQARVPCTPDERPVARVDLDQRLEVARHPDMRAIEQYGLGIIELVGTATQVPDE